MSDNQGTAKFATYGPNRGQSLHIGRYEFVDGICEVPQKEAHTASRILCRYHDVCPASELKERIAEYDAKYAAPEPAKTEPASPPDARKMSNKNELPTSWELSGRSIWGVSPFNARVRLAVLVKHADANRIDSEGAGRLMAAAPTLKKALEEIANGNGYYGAQAKEYKDIARKALEEINS